MFAQRFTVPVTTIADGSATAFSPVINGQLVSIQYVKPVSGGYSDGVGFTITNETTGETLWTQSAVNASTLVSPRQATHTTAGVASLYAAAGTAVTAPLYLANDRIKIVITSGGNVLTGSFVITVA